MKQKQKMQELELFYKGRIGGKSKQFLNQSPYAVCNFGELKK